MVVYLAPEEVVPHPFLNIILSVPLLAGMIHTDSPKRKLIFCTKIVKLLHHNLVLKAIIVTVGA